MKLKEKRNIWLWLSRYGLDSCSGDLEPYKPRTLCQLFWSGIFGLSVLIITLPSAIINWIVTVKSEVPFNQRKIPTWLMIVFQALYAMLFLVGASALSGNQDLTLSEIVAEHGYFALILAPL